MYRLFAVLFALCAAPLASAAPHKPGELTAASIEAAAPRGASDKDPALIAKAETLLDRAHFSPGEIDGMDGDNYRGAVQAFQHAHGLPFSGVMDNATWEALTSGNAEPALKTYAIAEAFAAGPFTKSIPAELERMAELHGLSYTSPLEALAEKFHMSPGLLRKLNPGADFGRAGARIIVANVRELDLRAGRDAWEAAPAENRASVAAMVVVDKPAHNVRAYDKDGRLLAFYPATAGSEEKPAPSGLFAVRRVDWNPAFHYDPNFAWKDVKAQRKLTIPPGPNNPVGLVWIDLTAPSYGIHGTPEPANIGKTESHGCIRLTNWDAVDLAAMVRPRTAVRFDDEDTPVAAPVPVSENPRPVPAPLRP